MQCGAGQLCMFMLLLGFGACQRYRSNRRRGRLGWLLSRLPAGCRRFKGCVILPSCIRSSSPGTLLKLWEEIVEPGGWR